MLLNRKEFFAREKFHNLGGQILGFKLYCHSFYHLILIYCINKNVSRAMSNLNLTKYQKLVERICLHAYEYGCLRPTSSDHHLYSQASSHLSFAEWERHFPWLTVDFWPRSYLVWSFKWVLRYSPSETKILTSVCASCAESFGQPCQIWHPRF